MLKKSKDVFSDTLKNFFQSKDYEEKLKCFKQDELTEKKKRIYNNFILADFPKNIQKYSLEDFKNKNFNKQYSIAMKFLNNEIKKNGLFLVGNVGSGKTTLACAIGKELIKRQKKVKFYIFLQLLLEIEETYSSNSTSTLKIIDSLCSQDLVILDDLGRESYTDKRKETIGLIFDKLSKNGIPLIVTANPEQMKEFKHISEFNSTLDRMKEMLYTVQFTNNSLRR